jgi:DNA-binding response OmpR family regulator
MSNKAQLEILLVDDESSIRLSNRWVLEKAGYKVVTAEHGFDALLALQTMMPDLIISDLNMPQMSGFEFLSVVRRRFPEIPVLAVSGAYDSGDQVPGGVIADDFYSKTRHDAAEFLRRVTNLIQSTSEKEKSHLRESAPVWIPRKRQGFQRGAFYRRHMHAMPTVFSSQRTQRRCAGDSGNTLSLLRQSSPVHYRFFACGLLAENTRASPGSRQAKQGVAQPDCAIRLK